MFCHQLTLLLHVIMYVSCYSYQSNFLEDFDWWFLENDNFVPGPRRKIRGENCASRWMFVLCFVVIPPPMDRFCCFPTKVVDSSSSGDGKASTYLFRSIDLEKQRVPLKINYSSFAAHPSFIEAISNKRISDHIKVIGSIR